MHIPDGYLSLNIIVATFLISIPILAFSIYKLRRSLDEKVIPFVGVLTATIFALQMINYPLGPGGTTGHIIGSPLISILFGPYVGVVSISIVLLLQAFLFGDGGITALGANILNMAIVGSVSSYLVFKLLSKKASSVRAVFVSSAVAGWVGIVLAAFFCGLELGLSYQTFGYGLNITIPVMTFSHAVLGIVEGLVTGFAVTAVMRYYPSIHLPAQQISKEVKKA